MSSGTWKNKIVLVTGAAGFLGSSLARRLTGLGAEVHALVRPESNLARLQTISSELQIHPCDLRDGSRLARVLQEIRPERLFHAAFPPGHPRDAQARVAMLHDGLSGTLNFLEALAPRDYESLVGLGSSLEYGSKEGTMREGDPPQPDCWRGACKAAEAHLFQAYCKERRRPGVWLRLFSVYGPWEPPHRFIPTLLRSHREGRAISLTPEAYRHDFIYAEDVVDACLLASALSSGFHLFNVGSGEQHSNQAVASLLEKITGRPLLRSPAPYPVGSQDRTSCVADLSKISSVLGWRPRHSLEAGLRANWEWAVAHA